MFIDELFTLAVAVRDAAREEVRRALPRRKWRVSRTLEGPEDTDIEGYPETLARRVVVAATLAAELRAIEKGAELRAVLAMRNRVEEIRLMVTFES